MEVQLPEGVPVQGARTATQIVVLLNRRMVWPSRLARWNAVARMCERLE